MAKNKNIKELAGVIPKVSEKVSKIQQTQIEYWSSRAINNYIAGEKEAFDVAKDLKKVYTKTIKEIEQKINGFYGKYAGKEGLTFEEIQQLLTKTELKDFKSYLNDCIRYAKKNNLSTKEYELLKLKTKVTRWQELKTQMQFELNNLTNTSQVEIGNLLYNTYEEGYYKTIFDSQQFTGTYSAFNGLNKQAIGKAVDTKYLGANYSSRLWENQTKLMNVLNQEIPRGIVMGYNPRKLAKLASDKLKTNYNNTVRLIRTEYNKVLNDTTMQGYRATGIDRYEILAALEQKGRTCEYCQELDSRNSHKAHLVSEAQVGINYPPFHPNCRCTTIPYFEPDEIDEMNEEELSNIGYITYDDWKNGLVKLEGNKVIYKTKLKR